MERLAEAEKLNAAGDKDGAIKIYGEVCYFLLDVYHADSTS